MDKLIIGIDPGKGGGVCFIDGKEMDFFKYPKDALDLEILMQGFLNSDREVFCVIEQVWAFPGDAKKAAFSFGFNLGVWMSVLERNEVNYVEIRPRKWQSYFETPKMEKKERKRWLKELASKYAIDFKSDKRVTFNVSDAILIAMYGRHLCEQK